MFKLTEHKCKYYMPSNEDKPDYIFQYTPNWKIRTPRPGKLINCNGALFKRIWGAVKVLFGWAEAVDGIKTAVAVPWRARIGLVENAQPDEEFYIMKSKVDWNLL